jgi:hypothetical protein
MSYPARTITATNVIFTDCRRKSLAPGGNIGPFVLLVFATPLILLNPVTYCNIL